METSQERTIWDLFQDLRSKYSDEVPEEEIHSTNKHNRYKVRTAWFTGISTGAQMLLSQNLITDSDQKKKVENFTKYTKSEEFHQRGLTTKDQIDQGNEILDILISLKPKNE